jgi:triosephosphate isomerase
MIRKWIAANAGEEVANATRIIYGGSVNETNAGAMISMKDIDGFLVGGASLKPTFA